LVRCNARIITQRESRGKSASSEAHVTRPEIRACRHDGHLDEGRGLLPALHHVRVKPMAPPRFRALPYPRLCFFLVILVFGRVPAVEASQDVLGIVADMRSPTRASTTTQRTLSNASASRTSFVMLRTSS